MTHVPYKGAGAGLIDLVSGHIQLMFAVGTALPPVKGGSLRPLGVSSSGRFADLPDVSTIAESGYPDYRVSVWYGIATATGTPAKAAQTISASFNRALDGEAFLASLTKIGFGPLRPRSEAAIKDFADTDRVRWNDVIKKLNIGLD